MCITGIIYTRGKGLKCHVIIDILNYLRVAVFCQVLQIRVKIEFAFKYYIVSFLRRTPFAVYAFNATRMWTCENKKRKKLQF